MCGRVLLLTFLFLAVPVGCLLEVRTFLRGRFDPLSPPTITTSVSSGNSTRLYVPKLNFTDGVLTFESLVRADAAGTESQISAAVDGVAAVEMETFEIEHHAKALQDKIQGFLAKNNGKEDSLSDLKKLGDQLSAFTLRVKGLNPNIAAAFSSSGKSSLEAGSEGPDDRIWGEGAINWDSDPSTPQPLNFTSTKPLNPSAPHTFDTSGREPHIRVASRRNPRTGQQVFEGSVSNASEPSSSSIIARMRSRGCDLSGWTASLSVFVIRADYFSAGMNSHVKDLDRQYDCLAMMIEANRLAGTS